MDNLAKIHQFLKDVGTYYLATVDGDQPRVRPFGTAHIFEGRLYIHTGKVKDVAKQLEKNGKAEICCFDGTRPCWTPTQTCKRCTKRTTATPSSITSRREQPSFPPSPLRRKPCSCRSSALAAHPTEQDSSARRSGISALPRRIQPLSREGFSVWADGIPGVAVNVEVDIIGKYVEKLQGGSDKGMDKNFILLGR